MTAASLTGAAHPAARLLEAARAAAEQAPTPGDGDAGAADQMARAVWAEQAAAELADRVLGAGLLPRRVWLGYPDATAVTSLGDGLFLRWRQDEHLQIEELTLLGLCPRCGTRQEAEIADLVVLAALLQCGQRCAGRTCPTVPGPTSTKE